MRLLVFYTGRRIIFVHMKVITLLVNSGPAYNPLVPTDSLEHQALQQLKEATLDAAIEKRKAEILEAVKNGTELPEKAKFPLDDEHIAILFNAETGEPIKPLSEIVIKAFMEYSQLPLASMRGANRKVEIYPHWVILKGLACMHPHPHRHFDGEEFYYRLGLLPELAERFLPKE